MKQFVIYCLVTFSFCAFAKTLAPQPKSNIERLASTDCKAWQDISKFKDASGELTPKDGSFFLKDFHVGTAWIKPSENSSMEFVSDRVQFFKVTDQWSMALAGDVRLASRIIPKDKFQQGFAGMIRGMINVSGDHLDEWTMTITDKKLPALSIFFRQPLNKTLLQHGGMLQCVAGESCVLHGTANKTTPLVMGSPEHQELKKLGIFAEANFSPFTVLCESIVLPEVEQTYNAGIEALTSRCHIDPPKHRGDFATYRNICKEWKMTLLPQLLKML